MNSLCDKAIRAAVTAGWMMWAMQAGAETATLDVLDMRLTPDAAWQRGTPAQEKEDESLLLSWPVQEGMAMHAVIPFNPPLIKSDAETFYRNLGRKWRMQYGKNASVGWVEAKGKSNANTNTRWLRCRRPASAGEGVVFHLVRVHEGRAYSVLLFAPASVEVLPQAAMQLLAGTEFGRAPVRWRNSETVVLAPQGEALEALSQLETDALGDLGMFTGAGIKAETTGELTHLNWFVDGFRWSKKLGRDEREPFETRGSLELQAPKAMVGAPVILRLNVEATPAGLGAVLQVHDFCGPDAVWKSAMEALRRGARGAIERAQREHACASVAPAAVSLEAGVGERAAREFVLPAALESANARWVEVRLQPPVGPGQEVLDRVGVVWVYTPQP